MMVGEDAAFIFIQDRHAPVTTKGRAEKPRALPTKAHQDCSLSNRDRRGSGGGWGVPGRARCIPHSVHTSMEAATLPCRNHCWLNDWYGISKLSRCQCRTSMEG